MLLIRDGRLCIAGVSFCLPNGLYLDTLSEVENPYGIELKDESGDVSIDVYAFNNQYSSEESLRHMLCDKDTDFELLESIAPISYNGLSGHACRYADNRCEYYEVIFDLDDNEDDLNAFSICVHASKNYGISNALAIQELKRLISDIRKD